MKKVLIVWGNWGPYHYARFRAFHELGKTHGLRVRGVELFPTSGTYEWRTDLAHPAVDRLDLGPVETEFNLWRLLTRLVPYLWNYRPRVIFVPSYWHWSLFLNYTGRLFGARIVMMNESHAGTERARGWKRKVKKAIVRHFDAGFVGGSPHVRHFANLGLDESRIHVGYDAVDNDYFTRESRAARRNSEAHREKLQLPDHYFLNLGRMVKKKNLQLLIHAYALFANRNPDLPYDLVLVGSGEEEMSLQTLSRELGLLVIDHTIPEKGNRPLEKKKVFVAAGSVSQSTPSVPVAQAERMPAVHFYGFRQIQENPIFYGLASAFILPSLYEEWGLVINEAMASELPVLASRTLGCAENLVEAGVNGFTFDPSTAGELANLMEKVTDPVLAEKMGKESLKRIQYWGCNRFATGAVAAAWAALENYPDETKTDE